MSKEKPILSVRISQELLDRLDAACEKAGIGRAEMVERCLAVGVVDQEDFMKLFESPVKGPLMEILFSPRFLKAVFSLTGQEIDEVQQTVKENISRRRSGRGVKAKLAVR